MSTTTSDTTADERPRRLLGPQPPDQGRQRFDIAAFTRKYAIFLILLGFVAVLSVMTKGTFLQVDNLVNVVVQVAPIGIIALGMMLAIITKGIDLSVGATVALAAVVASSLAQISDGIGAMYPGLVLPVVIPVAVGLAVGAATGFANGFLVAKFHIAPFIATLGMMTAARGLALIYTDGRPVSRLAPGFNFLGQSSVLGVPVPIWLFGICAVITYVILQRTRFGRHVYAIGGSEQAARVSGISLSRVQIGIYTFIGLLAGLAGMILAGRIGSGNPQLGTGIELDAITAAVIGGTSFNGGVGTVWGTVVGALILGIINNGLDLMNVSPFMQMVVKGVIIVLAIIMDERKNR